MASLDSNGRKRVVVTGMGAVTPLGESVAEFWDGLTAGRSGIGPMTLADPTDYPCRISGEVSGFDPERYVEKREARRLARFSQLAIAASDEAMRNAGLSGRERRLRPHGRLPRQWQRRLSHHRREHAHPRRTRRHAPCRRSSSP